MNQRLLLKLIGLLLLNSSLTLGSFGTLYGAELKTISTSSVVISLGPVFSGDSPDFTISKGLLNDFYYIYRNDFGFTRECVLKTLIPQFGTNQTEKLLVLPRVQLKLLWRGDEVLFLSNPSFVLRFVGTEMSSAGEKTRVIVDQNFALGTILPRPDGNQLVVSTDNTWIWAAFNPISLDGELLEGSLEICQVGANQNLFISEIEVQLSHTIHEDSL